MNLTHIKPGDKLAIPLGRRVWSGVPHVSHDIVVVNRVTATQLVGTGRDGSEVRVNRETGKILGGIPGHAIEATPELLAQNEAEVSENHRWHIADINTRDLIGKDLHQLKLTTAHLERLAVAWSEVKAMGSKTLLHSKHQTPEPSRPKASPPRSTAPTLTR